MEVRAKKALGQHFLTDQSIAKAIVAALEPAEGGSADVLEIGPGMGVLSQYLLQREDIDLKMIEIDAESVEYLQKHFPDAADKVIYGDFLKLDIDHLFSGSFNVIGNFPYNISSQIFFKVLDWRDRITCCSGMLQKEVAERIAAKPGSGAFAPPPKVQSAVIRLKRNGRTSLGCDEAAFKNIVKTSFGQRRKTMRNSLKPLILAKASREGWDAVKTSEFAASPVFELRPERMSVNDFIELTKLLA